MKKTVTSILMTVLLLAVTLLSLTACNLKAGGKSDASGDSATKSAEEILTEEPLVTEVEDDGRYHIGILTYRNHGAAEETVKGFKEEMISLLGSDKVEFEEIDAEGDTQKCADIATGFANSGYQLIFACGTEAVQNAGAAVKETPIIGGCVSDYLLSGVVSSLDAPGGNITGVSSMGPIDEQMDLVEQITPWPVSVAIITSGIETGSLEILQCGDGGGPAQQDAGSSRRVSLHLPSDRQLYRVAYGHCARCRPGDRCSGCDR